MSVRLIHPQIFSLPDSLRHSPSAALRFPSSRRSQVSCLLGRRRPGRRPRRRSPTTLSDAELALELSVEFEKMKVRAEERETAMNLSREMLFDELCDYLKMKSEREEVKRRWRSLPEAERVELVAAFVSDWSVDFHPLSRKGVKELLDEFIGVDEDLGLGNLDSVAAMGFDGLKRLIGFVSQ